MFTFLIALIACFMRNRSLGWQLTVIWSGCIDDFLKLQRTDGTGTGKIQRMICAEQIRKPFVGPIFLYSTFSQNKSINLVTFCSARYISIYLCVDRLVDMVLYWYANACRKWWANRHTIFMRAEDTEDTECEPMYWCACVYILIIWLWLLQFRASKQADCLTEM